MSPLRLLYLALAIWGAVHPMYYMLGPVQADGISGLLAAWQVNPAATGLFWDLVIAAIALIIWIVAEVSVRRNWLALVAIPATLCIGVSCGLPLYLFLRTRPVV